MTVNVDVFAHRIQALVGRVPVPVPWFLDIDGVLNIIGNRPRGGWPKYANTVIPAFEGLAWEVCYAPDLMDLLNLLHEQRLVSFRWLTTWEHDAPMVFAPAVGLDVGGWVNEDRTGLVGQRTQWWKLNVINDFLADDETFFVWTDDDINDDLAARQVVDMLLPGRALAICPKPSRGLKPEDFDSILTAIEEIAWG